MKIIVLTGFRRPLLRISLGYRIVPLQIHGKAPPFDSRASASSLAPVFGSLWFACFRRRPPCCCVPCCCVSLAFSCCVIFQNKRCFPLYPPLALALSILQNRIQPPWCWREADFAEKHASPVFLTASDSSSESLVYGGHFDI